MESLISGVRRHSLAEAAGIFPGERLVSVNGVHVKDIIELSYCLTEEEVELELEGNYVNTRKVKITKLPDEDLGLEFNTAVFDRVRTCYNHCKFCFVEQMIPGMRPGLYVRDDDYRLSFLYGNFVTLTNMKDEDYERIIATHMSPLYVSVHCTDPEMRCSLMQNRFAGDILEKLQRLIAAGIEVHTQIVCCPGYNDGEILAKSFRELYALHPGVLTMAIVPVGLTKQREGLAPMRTFTKEEAQAVVKEVTKWQRRCRRETGKTFVYLGDEFYLLADMELPKTSWYDGFPQLENGIGLTRSFTDEWAATLKTLRTAKPAEDALIPVGEGGYKILEPLMEKLNAVYGSNHAFVPIKNNFFGGFVNVTGLLTSGDLLQQLPAGKRLILPAVVLNSDELFLDDRSWESFKSSYDGRVELAAGAKELLHLLLTR